MAQIRKKLTARQLEVYVRVRDAYREAASAFRAAEDSFNLAATLLLDFYGFEPTTRAIVDDKLGELVVEEADPAPIEVSPDSPAAPVPADPAPTRVAAGAVT